MSVATNVSDGSSEAMVATAPTERAPGDENVELTLIDCDIHQAVSGDSSLFPYLPRQYVEYIKDFGEMMPGVGYTNMPGRGARTDLWVDTTVNPATLPEVCIEKHLDRYDIDYGILTGGPYNAAVHPDAD